MGGRCLISLLVKKSRFSLALILCYFPSRIVHPLIVGSRILILGGGGGVDLLFDLLFGFLFTPVGGAVLVWLAFGLFFIPLPAFDGVGALVLLWKTY